MTKRNDSLESGKVRLPNGTHLGERGELICTETGEQMLGSHVEFWTTETLQRDYTVRGFCAPFVMVVRKSDGVEGTLAFNHLPRVYFAFKASGDRA